MDVYKLPTSFFLKMRESKRSTSKPSSPMENPRRSPSATASFGIRASALHSQKDLEVRRRERQERWQKAVEESRKIMFEELKEKEEEVLREKESKKEEELKKFERKESVEEKEKGEELAKSNNFSSIIDLNLQELVEDCPYNASTIHLPSLMKKNVDIIPSAPLHIQPTFIISSLESFDEKTKDCMVENTITSQKLFVDDLFLCKDLQAFFAINSYNLKKNWSLSLFKDHICFRREKKASSMFMKKIKLDFQRLVFDPGGNINCLDLRTNPLEKGGYDVNLKRSILFCYLGLLISNKSLLWFDVCIMKKPKIEELHQDQGGTKRGAETFELF